LPVKKVLKQFLKNYGVLVANLEKHKGLVKIARYNQENLRITVSELDGNMKQCQYEKVELTEEISSMTSELLKIPSLQDDVVALKNSFNVVKCDNERLQASLHEVALEEKIIRPGDLTAREALCAHDVELKNEFGHMIRSNNQLQLKLNVPKEEKDECMKNSQVLEEKLEKIKDLKHDEIEISTNISDVEGSADETAADVASRIQSHENELAKALEEND
ncbi:hypothetical protein Tco_0846767, partial [Tanacetum coccineum]